jgi:hypothetical protein
MPTGAFLAVNDYAKNGIMQIHNKIIRKCRMNTILS